MPDNKKGDRRWLALCATTGIAVDVTLNKYSSSLPLWAILVLWCVPALLFVFWFWRVERTDSWLKHEFLKHPVSYIFMFLILIPVGWGMTRILIARIGSSPSQKNQ